MQILVRDNYSRELVIKVANYHPALRNRSNARRAFVCAGLTTPDDDSQKWGNKVAN